MAEPRPRSLVVNGVPCTVDVRSRRTLLDVLRRDLGLTGTKAGCDDGTCGTCTVLVDGKATRACRAEARALPGRDIRTIEGLGTADQPHALQRAFLAADAVQCGFCTPGMIMAAAALLERNPHPGRPEIVRWMGSNLCRCTGYQAIIDAIEWVARGEQGQLRTWPAQGGEAAIASPTDATDGRRIDALDKVTGRAIYAADIAVEGMLHARVLRSPHAHAEIIAITTDDARALPGVVTVLTAHDIPGRNSHGRMVKDQPILADSRVRQVGDPVALVVASSPEIAAAALQHIKVDYRVLRAVVNPLEALADGAPQLHPGGNLLAEHHLRHGDVEEGFARADIVVDETYTTPWNEHAYLEPDAALAYPDGETLVVRSATQHSHYHRSEIAQTLGLPEGRVRVLPTIVGGAFGGKTDISCQCLAALAAWRTGRPVQIVYSRAESFATTTKRHPYRIRCRSGVTRDGDLTALQLDMVADTGAYASTGPGPMIKAFTSASGPYRWPHVDFHGRVVYTNNPPAGSMRGPGTTQVAFAVESQMDLMAARLGLDPLEFRSRNRLRRGDRLLSGQVLESDPAYAATIDAVRPHFREAVARCEDARRRPSTSRRGVGVASIWYGIGGHGQAGRIPGRASLELRADGTVALGTGAVDLGQGSDTALAMIVARELCLPVARMVVRTGDTQAHPDAGPTAGSRVTYFVGNAARHAARSLRHEVIDTASLLLEQPVAELVLRDGLVCRRDGQGPGVSLSEITRARDDAGLTNTFEGVFESAGLGFDVRSGLAEPYSAYVTATQVAEVEVNVRTGAVKVLRVVAAHDVGRPVFLPGIVGQIEGGVAMGIGFALSEDFVPGVTSGFKTYRIPRARDVPEIVTILVDSPEDASGLQAKGVAECSNMVLAPAITNAIAHATGERVFDLPARLRHHEPSGKGAPG